MLIKLFASLQQVAGAGRGQQVSVPPGDATVRDALELLFVKVPALRGHILTPEGTETLPHVNIMVQGRLIRDLQGLQTPVTNKDTLAIFPPVAGG